MLRRQCEEHINDQSINPDVRDGYCQDILSYLKNPSGRSGFDARYFNMDHVPPKTFEDMFDDAT